MVTFNTGFLGRGATVDFPTISEQDMYDIHDTVVRQETGFGFDDKRAWQTVGIENQGRLAVGAFQFDVPAGTFATFLRTIPDADVRKVFAPSRLKKWRDRKVGPTMRLEPAEGMRLTQWLGSDVGRKHQLRFWQSEYLLPAMESWHNRGLEPTPGALLMSADIINHRGGPLFQDLMATADSTGGPLTAEKLMQLELTQFPSRYRDPAKADKGNRTIRERRMRVLKEVQSLDTAWSARQQATQTAGMVAKTNQLTERLKEG